VEFEGMKVQPTTFNTSRGTTQFVYEGQPYFWNPTLGPPRWK
jgi:hypothetical protein